MARALSCLVILMASLFGQAPETISGKVYREARQDLTPLLRISESTILFLQNGRFVYLKAAVWDPVSHPPPGARVLIVQPPADGTYAYSRSGSSVGVIELFHSNGEVTRMERTFATPSSGFVRPSIAPLLTFVLEDMEHQQKAPVLNVSMRGRVGENESISVGFVIPGVREPRTFQRTTDPGATSRDVLIRVVGPSLAQFGLSSLWANPSFRLSEGSFGTEYSVEQYIYDDWSLVGTASNVDGVVGFRKIFSYVGAFPLLEGSKDAVTVVRLPPGAYTVDAFRRSTDDPGGLAIIEIYFLP